MSGKKIKQIRFKDREVMKGLFRTGVATPQQLKKYCGINQKRLMDLKKDGYVSIDQGIVHLDKEGKDYCTKVLGMKYAYGVSPHKNVHDLNLAETYYRLDESIRETWKTETQIYHEAKMDGNFEKFRLEQIEQHPQGRYNAIPDAAFINSSGQSVAIDITTRSYSKHDIAQKQAFSEKYIGNFQEIRIN